MEAKQKKKKAAGVEDHLEQVSNSKDNNNAEITCGEDCHNEHDPHGGDLSAEAGGVVRGISRSILRSPIGRLPRRRIPVRQVARVSDRISTSMDWYSSAVEASSTSSSTSNDENDKSSSNNNTQKKRHNHRRLAGRITSMTAYWTQTGWPRIKNFTINITKNTILGLMVFETYGYVVSTMAPIEVNDEDDAIKINRTLVVDSDDDGGIKIDEGENSVLIIRDEIDEYARASLPVHFGAGFLAGSVHGIASGIVDGPTLGAASTVSQSTITFRAMTSYTLYHAMSHSCLFGVYEGAKRSSASMQEVTRSSSSSI